MRIPPRAARLPLAAAALTFVVALIALAVLKQGSEPDYRLSEPEAIDAALDDREVARFLERHPYTRAESIPLDSELRRVTFFDGPRVVLDAAVDPTGDVPFRQEHRPGTPESGSRVANSGWMLGLLTGLFLLATLVLPLRRIRNLDALALASFVLTVVLVNDRLVTASAAFAVVPLAYLIARCGWVALGRGAPDVQAEPLFRRVLSSRLAAVITGATGLAFLLVTLTSAGESDVATASLSGATQLLDGELPYGNIVEGVVHGDTYPLLTYVAYIPGALITPIEDAFSDRYGALYVTAAAAAVAAAGLYRLAGLRAVLAWLAFPPILLTASGGSNDMVLAAVLVWALVFEAGVGRSALLLTIAAWVKVVPLVAAPMWLARMRGREPIRAVAIAGALSAGLCLWLVALGGLGAVGEMVDGLAFQFQRGSFHAPWLPFDLEWLQLVVQAALAGALVYGAIRVRREPGLLADPARLAAAVGGILLWVQLAANYWTWAYLPWAFPFVLLALLTGSRSPSAATR